MLHLGQAGKSVDVATGSELALALNDAAVDRVVVVAPTLTVSDRDFDGINVADLPVRLFRNVTGASTDPVLWPRVTLGGVDKVVLGNGVWLTFTQLVMRPADWDEAAFRSPRFRLLLATPPGTKAVMMIRGGCLNLLYGVPPAFAEPYTNSFPRPPELPGVQRSEFINVSERVPPFNEWAGVMRYTDGAIDATVADPVTGSFHSLNYIQWFYDSWLVCDTYISAGCMSAYLDPVPCFLAVVKGRKPFGGAATPNGTASSGNNATTAGTGGGGRGRAAGSADNDGAWDGGGGGGLSTGQMVGAVVGGVVGGLAAAAALAWAWVAWRRRRRADGWGCTSGGGGGGGGGGGTSGVSSCSGGLPELEHKGAEAAVQLGLAAAVPSSGRHHQKPWAWRARGGGGGGGGGGDLCCRLDDAAADVEGAPQVIVAAATTTSSGGTATWTAANGSSNSSGGGGACDGGLRQWARLANGGCEEGSSGAGPGTGAASSRDAGPVDSGGGSGAACGAAAGMAAMATAVAVPACAGNGVPSGQCGGGSKGLGLSEEVVGYRTPLRPDLATDVQVDDGLGGALLAADNTGLEQVVSSIAGGGEGGGDVGADGAAAQAAAGVGTGATGLAAGGASRRRLTPAAGPDVVEVLPVVLGKGGYGRVFEGRYRGMRVAVKQVLTASGAFGMAQGATADARRGQSSTSIQEMQDAVAQAFAQEVDVLGRCDHPNIARLYAACLTPPKLALVMELADTSLDKLLFREYAGSLMPLGKVLHIATQIALGLCYLHPTIVHRDLKPANVLINNPNSDTPVVKLTDFGIARIYESTRPTVSPESGTVTHMAPECFDVANNVITHRADIYSFGVVVWTLLSGQEPWQDLRSGVEVAVKLAMYQQRLPLGAIPQHRRSAKLDRLLSQCWEADPLRRPAAADISKELVLLRQMSWANR
ncbi:hypothetical protein HXX76_008426 [Chlamydomonas incerta]|uniref:Protein kinase domain-containing protein n=1 Tax=Chlamydomonas incerta TaxID=51695 RepID=A0A835T6G7_CHLIN|nr:hypothetical protein HXX76_008426 [Chlamydomonas incerta]|eukprot:KAG2433365.1 hypothetical protein HXX76_008426 [Chlamydomonas incerta]